MVIRRRGAEDVALLSAPEELRSLRETAHLLRSPRNAARLLRALSRAQGREGRPHLLAKLLRELKLEPNSRGR
jgi:antitoxin YefM